MIARGGAWLRKIRQWLSCSQWAVHLLRLSKSAGPPTRRGLVMIQIDGLSRRQLQRASGHGTMPFLKRLLAKECYRLHTFYSGLPSSTPSVQGELFYGYPCAVPAFSFRDSQTGQVVRMSLPDPALRVESRLNQRGEGLLEGGSAYCDIYPGAPRRPTFARPLSAWEDCCKRSIHSNWPACCSGTAGAWCEPPR